MRLDAEELDALAEDLTRRLVPRLLAELREHLRPAADDAGLAGITELAEHIPLSVGTIRARTADGSIPCVRVGRRVLYRISAVLEALQET